MGTTQAYGVMDFILKKKQTIPEFIASDMRVIRFTLIFYYPTPFHITSDLTGNAEASHMDRQHHFTLVSMTPFSGNSVLTLSRALDSPCSSCPLATPLSPPDLLVLPQLPDSQY